MAVAAAAMAAVVEAMVVVAAATMAEAAMAEAAMAAVAAGASTLMPANLLLHFMHQGCSASRVACIFLGHQGLQHTRQPIPGVDLITKFVDAARRCQ